MQKTISRKKAIVVAVGATWLIGPSNSQANISSTLESINALSDQSGYQVNDVILISELQRLVVSKNAVQSGQYALMSEIADTDNDNTQEAPEMKASLTGFTPPSGGGFVPDGSLSSKVDGYGMPLGYCAWDHGASNASTNRLSGDATVSNSNVSFAVISSGKDRTFNVSCADVQAGSLSGDDIVASVTIGQGNYGVATNDHFGRPVGSMSDLLGLDTTNTKPGELRMVLDTGMTYGWLDLNSDGLYEWEAVSSYFYSGDSNGLSAGGEYTTNPYSVGIGPKFADRSIEPASELEVDGKVRIVNSDQWVDTDGGAQLHVGSQEVAPGTSGEIARIAIQPYGHNGGPFNLITRDDAGKAYLDLRYGTSMTRNLFVADADGFIGIGDNLPEARLSISGPDNKTTGPIIKFHGDGMNQVEGGRLRFSEGQGYLQGSYIHYNALDNVLSLGVHKNHTQAAADDLDVLSIVRDTGNVGVNTRAPEADFHIKSKNDGTSGDATLLVEADYDNSFDGNNPKIKMFQDGRRVGSVLALNGANDAEYAGATQNATYLESVYPVSAGSGGGIQFVTGRDTDISGSVGTARMTITGQGNIGIGTNDPTYKLQVQNGDVVIYGDDRYVSYRAYRRIDPALVSDDDGNGYEHFSAGVSSGSGVAHISGSRGIAFHQDIDVTQVPAMYLSESGNLGLGVGNSEPEAQLDIFRNSNDDYNVKVRNGGGASKNVLISGGNSGGDASLLRVQNYDNSDRFFEVTDGAVHIGNGSSGDTQLCLNGKCSTSIKSSVVGSATLNDSTYTPIAYVQGERLGSIIDLSISGTSLNNVVNTTMTVVVGHDKDFYIESLSQDYDQLNIKVQTDDREDFIVYAKLDTSGVDVPVRLEATARNNEVITFNPTNTLTGTAYEHTTKGNGIVRRSSGSGASLSMDGDLEVSGIASFNQNVEAGTGGVPTYHFVGSFEDNRSSADVTTHGYTIKTNIPGPTGSGTAGIMNKIHVEGYSYSSSLIVDFTVVFYVYPTTSAIVELNYKNDGTYMPDDLEIAQGPDGKIWLRFTPSDYKMRFHASHYSSYGQHKKAHSQGWRFSVDQGTLSGMAHFKDFLSQSENHQMKTFMSTFGGKDDYHNSPISIRERGGVENSTTDNRWAPSLNFHWKRTNSKSLWINASGVLSYGDYDSAGNPGSNGTIRASTFTSTSDRRMKKDIAGISQSLDTIRSLDGVTYHWKDSFSDDKSRQYGFVAQDLMKTLPDAVVKDTDGYYSVKYNSITPILVEAVKDLDQKVEDVIEKTEEHDEKIKEYEVRIKANKAEISRLKEEIKLSKSAEAGNPGLTIDGDKALIKDSVKTIEDSGHQTPKAKGEMSRFYGQ